MSGLIDAATAMMTASSRRVDSAAINIANVSTTGFKRQLRPTEQTGATFDVMLAQRKVDLRAGKLTETGRPLDLSINGDGFFQFRAGDQLLYSRQGGFTRDADGRVVDPRGYFLQQAGGGDLILDSSAVTIAADGTVLSGERPLGRIAVMQGRSAEDVVPIDGSLFKIADQAAEVIEVPSLRQGALEASNVSLGDEMIGMMGALRSADTGARLVQLYDDLMGKAINTFSQAGR